MSVNGRDLALKALSVYRRNGGFSDTALNSVLDTQEDSREKALAARLYYTVLSNSMLINYYLDRFCKGGCASLQPQVKDILSLCAAQLLFFDRIPAFSAVNEAVAQCKRSAPQAAGLVNAVCRRLSDKEHLPEITGSDAECLSIMYSHPLWFTETMLQVLGSLDECGKYLAANNEIPPVFIRENTLMTGSHEACVNAGLSYSSLYGCFTARNFHDNSAAGLLKKGLAYVQDPASAAAVAAAGPQPGMTVIDVCSAPGGKSFASAMRMQNRGRIFSFDLSAKKIPVIESTASLLGITCLQAAAADGRIFRPELEKKGDIVFTDVPCSGFGVIRKKPEIRYKNKEDILRLPEIGLSILSNASRYVKPGGVLLYSTCTVLPQENEQVVNSFLSSNKHFTPESFKIFGSESNGKITLYPHIYGTDGFFICKLRCNG